MNLEGATVDLLACPECGASVQDTPEQGGGNGRALVCAGCQRRFPILHDIPRFVASEGYAGSFGLQWNAHRQTQLDSHTGLAISRDRLFGVTGWSTDLQGETILEAGCGAGRFTEVLVGTGASVFSFDYSLAVEANRTNNGSARNLCLFQADIFHIPARRQAFDKVMCLGVIQHTPDPHAAFLRLAEHVKPGGQLVVDAYARRLSALVSWKYLLRPITTRMKVDRLYRLVERTVDALLPAAAVLRRVGGRVGVRLLPIAEYSHLGLPGTLNRDWAVLDTYDMYAPAHDHPQSGATLKSWFREAGFEAVTVGDGPNGVVGRGRRPVGKPGEADRAAG